MFLKLCKIYSCSNNKLAARGAESDNRTMNGRVSTHSDRYNNSHHPHPGRGPSSPLSLSPPQAHLPSHHHPFPAAVSSPTLSSLSAHSRLPARTTGGQRQSRRVPPSGHKQDLRQFQPSASSKPTAPPPPPPRIPTQQRRNTRLSHSPPPPLLPPRLVVEVTSEREIPAGDSLEHVPNNGLLAAPHFRNGQQRRRGGLSNPYVPDLVLNCPLSVVTLRSWSATPSPEPELPPRPSARLPLRDGLPLLRVERSNSYEEIGELLPKLKLNRRDNRRSGDNHVPNNSQHHVRHGPRSANSNRHGEEHWQSSSSRGFIADQQQQQRPRNPICGPSSGAAVEMGQNLSLRKPRLSMTWVLREQQQQQPLNNSPTRHLSSATTTAANHRNLFQSSPNLTTAASDNTASSPTTTLPSSASSIQIRPKKPRNGKEAANGLSLSVPKVINGNLLLHEDKQQAGETIEDALINGKLNGGGYLLRATNRPTKAPINGLAAVLARRAKSSNGLLDNNNNSQALKNNNDINQANGGPRRSSSSSSFLGAGNDGGGGDKKGINGTYPNGDCNNNSATATTTTMIAAQGPYKLQQHHLVQQQKGYLDSKSIYSEPSYCVQSEPARRHHRHHRKRRDRSKSSHHHHNPQPFGYDIKNVDEFLSQCSLLSPGNIPVVLSNSSTLYQTRPGYQLEIPVPLGMVVNAVFKNQQWLYVQTPHAEEGYIAYDSCLPLGILPTTRPNSVRSKPGRCWETTDDVYPKPGNMTDSEKEYHYRSTRSEGARTPSRGGRRAKSCGEKNVDSLYLKAASQPKLVDKTYAQLKNSHRYSNVQLKSNDDYVVLRPQANPSNDDGYSIVSNNIREANQPPPQQQLPPPHRNSISSSTSQGKGSHQPTHHHHHNHSKVKSLHPSSRSSSGSSSLIRQTLLAVHMDFESTAISVRKGDVVTLLGCKEYRDKNAKVTNWFYVKNRNGTEGFIPAEVAGHGYL